MTIGKLDTLESQIEQLAKNDIELLSRIESLVEQQKQITRILDKLTDKVLALYGPR